MKNWSIKVTSFSNRNGLEKSDINDFIYGHIDPRNKEYQEFLSKLDYRVNDMRGGESEFSLKKKEGINLFFENLKVNYGSDKISISSEFKLSLPSEYDEPTILDMFNGFDIISNSYPTVAMFDLKKGIHYKDDMLRFSKELSKNLKCKIDEN